MRPPRISAFQTGEIDVLLNCNSDASRTLKEAGFTPEGEILNKRRYVHLCSGSVVRMMALWGMLMPAGLYVLQLIRMLL